MRTGGFFREGTPSLNPSQSELTANPYFVSPDGARPDELFIALEELFHLD